MELHLFIIWEKGRHLENEITDDIRKHFSILQTIDIMWSQEMVSRNFSRFYGVNLPIGIDKRDQCGGGEFRVLVVEDHYPQYDLRETSRGKEYVNINMFDSKIKYRQWVGLPNKIHATNNSSETNHDLTLLLGINSYDYQSTLNAVEPYVKKKQDIIGAQGWGSTEQLFYVLNNTINYVILRGADGLKRHEFCNSHRDCDLLVDNVANAQLIINGTTYDGSKRPHEAVTINNYTYYLDLWGCKQNYFDIQWCKEMLATKKEVGGYYILDETNNFYCLLYHCLITKNHFSEDYLPLLEKYRDANFGVSMEYPKLLVDFMRKKNYEIVQPKNNGAGFHIDTPILYQYYNKYGKVISKTSRIHKDGRNGQVIEWKSCVYDNGDTIIKSGTHWLIDNEYYFLKELEKYKLSPQCLKLDTYEDESLITLEKINGCTLNQFLREKNNIRKRTIKKISSQIINILKLFKDHGIIHRDFKGDNILIDNLSKVYAIDFGWAINNTHKNDKYPCPDGMAGEYRPQTMYSDFYTVGAVLREIYNYRMPYLNNIGEALQSILWDDYFDCKLYNQKIKIVEAAVNAPFCFKDYFHCILLRHTRISCYYYKIKHRLFQFFK